MLSRRSFLTGAAFSVAATMAYAAQQSQTPESPKSPPPEKPNEKPNEKPLIDADGREYRVCPQCGNNMYKQGRMWVCEVCGYSYVE